MRARRDLSPFFGRLLGGGGGGGGGLNPGDGTVDPGGIVGDYEWWASDLSSLSDGDPVAASGAPWVRHAGAAVASDLGTVAGAGVPTLRFDATGVRVARFIQSHSDGLGLTVATGGADFSIYVLLKLNSANLGTFVGSSLFKDSHLQFRANGPFAGPAAYLNLLRQQEAQLILGATALGTTWHLVEVHTDGANSHNVVLDGVVDGSATTSPTFIFNTVDRVGMTNGGEYLDGDLAALVISDTQHDATQKAAMRARLHASFSRLIGP